LSSFKKQSYSNAEDLCDLFIDPVLLLAAFVPIKNYSNAETDKGKILKENKDKSGIYK
jgi:hypothetical protein